MGGSTPDASQVNSTMFFGWAVTFVTADIISSVCDGQFFYLVVYMADVTKAVVRYRAGCRVKA